MSTAKLERKKHSEMKKQSDAKVAKIVKADHEEPNSIRSKNRNLLPEFSGKEVTSMSGCPCESIA